MEVGAEISQKIRAAIKAKLVELKAYVDDELPDYIMVMVANKKTQQQMTEDLSLFLGSHSRKFCTWLHEVLYKLQSVTVDNLKEDQEKVTQKSSESGDSHKATSKNERTTEEPKSSSVSRPSHSAEKRKNHGDESSDRHSKIRKRSGGTSNEKDRKPSGETSTGNKRDNGETKDEKEVKKGKDGGQKDDEDENQKVSSAKQEQAIEVVKKDEDENIDPEQEKEEEEPELAVKPGEDEKIDSEPEEVAPPSIKQTTSKKPKPSLKMPMSQKYKPDAVKAGSTSYLSGRKSEVKCKQMSVIGGVINRQAEDDDDEEDYDPRYPSVGSVASAIHITPRRFLPKTLQANKSLLLRAMTDAESSVASVARLAERSKQGRHDREVRKPDSTHRESVKSRLGKRSNRNERRPPSRSPVRTEARRGESGTSKRRGEGSDDSRSLPVLQRLGQKVNKQAHEDKRSSSGIRKKSENRQQFKDNYSSDDDVICLSTDSDDAVKVKQEVIDVTKEDKKPANDKKETDATKEDDVPVKRKEEADEENSKADRETKLKDEAIEKESSKESEKSTEESENEMKMDEDVLELSADVDDADRRLIHVGQEQEEDKNDDKKEINQYDQFDENVPERLVEDASAPQGQRADSPKFIVTLEGVDDNFVKNALRKPKTLAAVVKPTVNTTVNVKRQPLPELQQTTVNYSQSSHYYPQEYPAFQQVAQSVMYQPQASPIPHAVPQIPIYPPYPPPPLLAPVPTNTSQYYRMEQQMQQYPVQPIIAPPDHQAGQPDDQPQQPSPTVCAPPHEEISFSINDSDDEDEAPKGIKSKRAVERCRFWPACKQGDVCEFHHPTVTCRAFPNCLYGDKCLYIHPNCKFDASCTKLNCPYTHASKRNLSTQKSRAKSMVVYAPPPKIMPSKNPRETICKFHPKCSNLDCKFLHPGPCRYGTKCTRSDCIYTHPNIADKAALKWISPKAV